MSCEIVELQAMENRISARPQGDTDCSTEDDVIAPEPPPRRKRGMGTNPKSVAFLSETEGSSEGKSPDGITSLRHISDDSDSGAAEEALFPGLYPVVFLRLKQTSVPRIWCLKIVANPWFERVSMFVILINCITLGLYEPCEHNTIHCESEKCKILAMCDHLVFAFFAVEMLIKMIAMGIWGKLGYLGEAWNRLDFFIVICGMLEYTLQIDEMVNFTSVRTVRVLRPLRAINRVPSMRILVMLLLDTLPMLGNVLMLCSFVFFIFGVVAVQLWAGTLRQRCFPDPNVFRLADDGSTVLYNNASTSLPPYYSYQEDDGGAQICSLPTFSGEFRCSDPDLVLPSLVDDVTCSLNVSHYVTSQPMDQLYNDTSGNQNCINWNQYYNTCRAGDENPYMGAISFDNIMYAWVAIFQVISLEGWVDIMYFVMDGYSFYSFIYFILLIVIGSFFMINLCLVVIATQFSETKQREQRLMEEQRLRFKSNDSTLASYSPPGNCYEEMLKYISHVYRKRKRRIKRWWRRRKNEKREKKQKGVEGSTFSSTSAPVKSVPASKRARKKTKSIHLHHHHHHHYHHYHISDSIERGERLVKVGVEIDLHDAPPFDPGASPVPTRLMLGDAASDTIEIPAVKNSFRLTLPQVSPSFATSARSLPGSLTSDTRHKVTPDRRRSGDVTITSAGAIYFSPAQDTPCKDAGRVEGYLCSPGCARKQSPRGSFYLRSPSASPSKRHPFVRSDVNCSCSAYDITDPDGLESAAEEVVYDDTVAAKHCCCKIGCKSKWTKFRDFCSEVSSSVKRVVDSRYFNRGIMVAILINTMSMGIEHHNQPQTLTEILEISNVVFTTLFVLEMLAKLIAFGIVGYTKNLYNMFDAVIVIISVWEIVAGTQNGGGLSVLRTFRLLRVLKLVRFLPALRRQLVVLMRTMDNVATFMMLLTLFIFIFSILGMHLFGCEFCTLNDYGETECDRKNFDSLLWAFVTVFQILTQEDWNIVLYNGMAATHPAAAIYFITLMTIGNYVLFNLLVAILVEGFQAECYPDRLQADDESDDDVSDCGLADEYTRKVASALGLRQPLPSSRAIQRQNSMHRVEMASTSSSIYSSDDDIRDDVPIVLTSSGKDDVIASYSDSDDETFTRDLPIITRTAATPLPTPTPLTSHNSLDEKQPGLSFEQCKFFKGAEYGSIISIDRRCSDSSYGQPATLSSDSRKSSTASRLSVSSHIRSFRSKNKELPLDQQSLVSGIADDHEDYCDDDDVYSNSSFIMSAEGRYNDADDRDESLMERAFDQKSLSVSSLRREKSCEHGHQVENFFCRCCQNFTSCCAIERLHKFTSDRRTWSLYLLPPDSRLRKSLQRTVASKWFDYIILLFIFGNCVTIAMERPSLEEDSYERYVIDVFNYVFTVVFTVELLLKVIASGFYFGDSNYLKSGWNVLDFILVVTSLIDVMMTLASSGGSKLFGILRVLRLLRALRPLRVISRAPGLKVVVQTLLSSLKPIGNIVLICCAFFIIFGILGVQVFKGKFYHCEGPNIRHVTNRTQCLEFTDNAWINHRYNFDDLGQALMSLFVLSSKDGWVEIMYHGIDAVGVDQQPVENYNPWMLIYFISFLLIVGFFVLNMFVGVVVENFHRCREQHELEEIKRREELRRRKEERLLLKKSRRLEAGKRENFRKKTLSRARSRVDDFRGFVSRSWRRMSLLCCKRLHQKDDVKYYERYSRCRRAIHDFCMNKYFEVAVSLIIGVNILTMATEHYQQPKELGLALKYANYAFTAVFVLEAVLKLIALGICRYFKDKWNQLDMLIVVLSIVGIIIEDMSSGSDRSLFINPTIIRVMRVLRIARVLKLLKISKGIRSLLETVACALPQVGNLGMLFVLLFFIFAALGVELFGTLTCDAEHPCEGLNRHASFHNFGIALLTLFRISTGDNWNGIMKDTLRETCDSSAECRENCCVSTIISPVYFVLFVMMAQFVLVNVVVAVLMKQLEDNRLESSNGEEEEEDDDVFEDDVDDDDVAFDGESDSEGEIPVDSVASSSDNLYDEPDERDSLIGRYTESVTLQELQRTEEVAQNMDNHTSRESLGEQSNKTKSNSSIRTSSLTSCHSIEQLKVVNDVDSSSKINSNLPRRIVPTRRSTSPNIPTSISFNPLPQDQNQLQVPAKPKLTGSLSLPLPFSIAPSAGDKIPRRSLNNNHHMPPERRLSDYCTTCECCQQNVSPPLPVRSSSTNIPTGKEEGAREQHLLTVPRNHVTSEKNKSFPQISVANPVANSLHSSRSTQIPSATVTSSDVWLSFDDDRPD